MSQISDGIININKPAEWTSHDCVAVLRGKLGIKRIGHTGTLDPMATGVLPICIGPTTRIMEYLDLDFKTYICEMKLGLVTDTLDIWGETIEEKDFSHITAEDVQQAFAPFHGIIEQIPPKYSALKVNGKKLYQYARAGEEVEIKSRTVYLDRMAIKELNLDVGTISFEVTCSKGTYIRSICRDVGEALGCGAAMSALTRTASGVFTIKDAVPLEELRQMDERDIGQLVKKTDYPLVHFGKAIMDRDTAMRFCNGWHIALPEVIIEKGPEYENRDDLSIREEYKKAYNMYAKDEGGSIFLGVAFYNGKYKKLVADKVFFR